jgi:hypothetical protein
LLLNTWIVFSLLKLATPRIGPPPKVGPLNPEPEFELEFDADPFEFELSPAPDESLESLLLESLPAEFCPSAPPAG